MSNFLLKEPDCVLIHIPKTGGSSIRHGVWQGRYDGPAFGEVPAQWQRFFKFAFCRHPLDRLVSAWADFTQHRRSRLSMEEFVDIVIDESIDFGESRANQAERIRHHTIPQTHPFNCIGEADVIGRYENYAADLRAILDRVGICSPGKLPEIRKTEHGHWADYLHGTTLEKSIAFYQDDFNQLKYELPG